MNNELMVTSFRTFLQMLGKHRAAVAEGAQAL